MLLNSIDVLVIADGFYEWKAEEKQKTPYYIRIKDSSVFGMAGIWDRWIGENEVINSCAIITTEANKTLLPIHNRMSAIIKPEYYSEWLSGSHQNIEKVKSLLKPYPEDDLSIFPVSRKVNNFRYNKPDCIKALELNS